MNIKLYQNVYTDKKGNLVWYQQYHRTLEDAQKTLVKQSNGDVPAFTFEIIGFGHPKPE